MGIGTATLELVAAAVAVAAKLLEALADDRMALQLSFVDWGVTTRAWPSQSQADLELPWLW